MLELTRDDADRAGHVTSVRDIRDIPDCLLSGGMILFPLLERPNQLGLGARSCRQHARPMHTGGILHGGNALGVTLWRSSQLRERKSGYLSCVPRGEPCRLSRS